MGTTAHPHHRGAREEPPLPHPNADLLERCYEAFERADLATVAACFDRDVAFH